MAGFYFVLSKYIIPTSIPFQCSWNKHVYSIKAVPWTSIWGRCVCLLFIYESPLLLERTWSFQPPRCGENQYFLFLTVCGILQVLIHSDLRPVQTSSSNPEQSLVVITYSAKSRASLTFESCGGCVFFIDARADNHFCHYPLMCQAKNIPNFRANVSKASCPWL